MEVKLNDDLKYLNRTDIKHSVFNDVSYRLDLSVEEMTAMINLFQN